MNAEDRIERLERMLAAMRARQDMMFIAFCSMLAGELTQENVARLTESLTANALNTSAPDAAADAFEQAGDQIRRALIAGNRP